MFRWHPTGIPHFYSTAESELQSAQQQLSRKQQGSNSRERERKNVARIHRKIRRCREDHHWKLAKSLVHHHDILCFETLCFEGMKRLWGRKVSDIAPYAFHLKLRHQAKKHGKRLCYIVDSNRHLKRVAPVDSHKCSWIYRCVTGGAKVVKQLITAT
ncbi:hypothetical protein C6500_09160 [Candidatus Poribacteria bacterium]|nr:MAG: hypothetical protein C6500_09160 [Candidatus Poribacteria bacterium]